MPTKSSGTAESIIILAPVKGRMYIQQTVKEVLPMDARWGYNIVVQLARLPQARDNFSVRVTAAKMVHSVCHYCLDLLMLTESINSARRSAC
jgi:hypothetical protein